MQIGVTMHATDLAMDVAELAVEAEARGFHSLYVPEHTHIPTSRRTPPPTGDAVLSEEYKRSPDPLVALAAAAARTRRILLGTGVALPAQHDAIAWAKQVATLDRISGGRLVLGIGYGWNHEEMENHGIDVKRRRQRVRETLLAAGELWSKEVAEFHGEFVRFEPSCREAAKGSVGLSQTIESCRRSEEAARDILVKNWKNFHAADRDSCYRLTRTGTPGTYTELLTCLEMRRDARALPDPGLIRKKLGQ